MNNDLISREALKEALRSNCKPEICHDCNTNWCRFCCPHNDFEALIDEAPTIEEKSYAMGYQDGAEDGLQGIRTEGKWIIDGHHIRCNKCNEYICTEDREGNSIPDNFCPNCGADMRGGAE